MDVIVLAIDTCDARGSVAVLREDVVLALAEHEAGVDYSNWLLLVVEGVLERAGLRMADVDGYAVASGPGSFTGVRVGLTTVKGWAEVYGKPVVPVSRLEAIAEQGARPVQGVQYVAALVDAQRGQVFGAVYRRRDAGLARIGEEMVIAPGRFVEEAARLAGGEELAWVSPDGEHLLGEAAWKDREAKGERIERVSAIVAAVIGRMGARRLREGRTTDALGLDANYVRRSDAEIFWKGGRLRMAAELKRERVASKIRTMRAEDAASVAEILRHTREAVFWPESSVKEVLRWEGAVALVSAIGSEMVGFLFARQAADEAEILNLAVKGDSRRKGEGGGLLKAAAEELQVRGVRRVFLEVRESNEAGIAFYKKHGFSESGRRAGYYREPEETAIVMEKRLAG